MGSHGLINLILKYVYIYMVIVDILTYMLEHVGVYHGIYRTCIQCIYIIKYYTHV